MQEIEKLKNFNHQPTQTRTCGTDTNNCKKSKNYGSYLFVLVRGKKIAIFLILSILILNPVLAQQDGRVSYRSEITNLERKLENRSLAASERRSTLISLARLRQFAGNIESAAEAWALAANAREGNRDDEAYIEMAQCLIAMGEWGRASTAIKTMLTSVNPQIRLKARYLDAQLAVLGSKSGDYSALTTLLTDNEFAENRAQILYFLWKVSENQEYRTRLLREFGGSPEALIAATSPDAKINPSPTALWLLFPGRESLTIEAPTGILPETTTVAESAGGAVMLQVGLYSGEANAKAMEERLKAKGFTATIVERMVNGTKFWAVGTPAGSDYNNAIIRLKDAGFESFPVF